MTDFDSAIPESNPKDAEYLSRLQDYYADWKSIPSYASLCEVFGIASKSWVKAILDRLGKAGYLERTPDGMWIPTKQFFARPMAESSVPAGMPVMVAASRDASESRFSAKTLAEKWMLPEAPASARVTATWSTISAARHAVRERSATLLAKFPGQR
jgi:hypothetical protein